MLKINEVYFLNLLSRAIRNQSINELSLENIDWFEIYKISMKQNIASLIYPVIRRAQFKGVEVPAEISGQWEYHLISSAFFSFSQIDHFTILLNEFHNNQIPVILYRGIVMRNIYPYPETRTMGDIDVLVKEEDTQKCEEILKKLGYGEIDRGPRLVQYINKENISIELHNRILFIPEIEEFKFLEDILWENTEVFDYNGMEVYVLCPSYNLATLVLHVYKHYISSGIGIRQLCDIALLIEKFRDKIDWGLFWTIIIKVKKEAFAAYILQICCQYLNLELSKSAWGPVEINETYLDALLTDIVNGGVFSYGDEERLIENSVLINIEKGVRANPMTLLKTIFVSPENLTDKYSYAKKIHWLLPLAWAHHTIDVILNNRRHILTYFRVKFNLPFAKNRSSYLESIGLINKNSEGLH